MNPDHDEILLISSNKENITVHSNVSDMRSLIDSYDIAVSASGSTLYEICSCGVPLVVFTLADNQIMNAEAFEKMGLAISCGNDSDEGFIDRITNAVKSLDKKEMRDGLSNRMQNMIDGCGASRIAERLTLYFS